MYKLLIPTCLAVWWWTGIVAGTQSTFAATCPVPALVALSPPPAPARSSAEQTYDPLRGSDRQLNLGVGHLRAVDLHDWNWASRLTLPLFSTPQAPPIAWLVDGWVVPADAAPRPFGFSGLVETGYEIPSFVVMEERADGWVQLRIERGDPGVVWTHSCFFDQAVGALAIERWETRFVSDEISPLYFRARVPHALRTGPTETSERLRWIPADPGVYNLYPSEVRGDWMRVELADPSDYCSSSDEPAPPRTTGWVRWRDDTTGPWVWYYTRGC